VTCRACDKLFPFPSAGAVKALIPAGDKDCVDFHDRFILGRGGQPKVVALGFEDYNNIPTQYPDNDGTESGANFASSGIGRLTKYWAGVNFCPCKTGIHTRYGGRKGFVSLDAGTKPTDAFTASFSEHFATGF